MPSPSYEPLSRYSSDSDLSEVLKLEFQRYTTRRPFLLRLARKATRFCRPLYAALALLLLLLCQITFNASYTNPTPFTIPTNETVFIAANIIDGDLIEGAWGHSLLELVHLIGKDRVFVSIYGGPKSSLKTLEDKLPCSTSIVAEEDDPIIVDHLEHTKLPAGGNAVKRIAWLTEVRNKALKPLDTATQQFDKVLFMNDVFYDPMDAARLLWGTNLNQGKADYKAVCATDFVAWWKFYDTFATRDLEGVSMGVPIFPWFGSEGDAASRADVLAGRDAVRVKSCWGGMVAFDARYFQNKTESSKESQTTDATSISKNVVIAPTTPLRFRFEHEALWSASECCLINADILALPPFGGDAQDWGNGIYMNPFVRVSYDASTQSRLWIMMRFERLLSPLQAIINFFAEMPHHNARRTEIPGMVVKDKKWVPFSSSLTAKLAALDDTDEMQLDWEDRGSYGDVDRVAGVGGFCGVRHISVIKEGPLAAGEKNWVTLKDQLPPLPGS